MRVLSVNCGSSTLKFDVLDVEAGTELAASRLASGVIDRVGGRGKATLLIGGDAVVKDHQAADHAEAFSLSSDLLEEARLATGIETVGHRVVHGGTRFREPVLIDDAVVEAIEAVAELAPLHNRPALAAVAAARSRFGPTMPMAATFDTAFYADLPDVAVLYALPRELSERLGIRRYGFHGLAHRYMIERFRALHPDVARPRLITLQLGSGCSATASVGGCPLDTSMGFTPLEGLIMGTRSGDIDPSIPGYLTAKLGLSPAEVQSMLNNESGLLGLSGHSNDMRDLLESSKVGDPPSDLAVRAFCYRAKKYVGSYLAALGGADAIIFGGGIGEHLPEIRATICEGLEWAGLKIDPQINRATESVEGCISTPESLLRAYVIPVQEAVVIARDTYDCLSPSTSKGAIL